MQTENFFQIMSDGMEVAVNRWIPDDGEEIKGVVQLSHGMLEHSMRYDRLGCIFSEHGYVFSAHDHRGHGKTAQNALLKGNGMFGKLAERNGFKRAVQDLDEVITELRKDYPGKKVILIGHSFGSFVSQAYIESGSVNLAGCILCGSAGPRNVSMFAGNLITEVFKAFLGPNFRSRKIQNLAFMNYQQRIQNPENDFEWLSANKENVEMYLNDTWCGGTATLSFFHDLMTGLMSVHKKSAMKRIPKSLPVFLIAGEDDPVGSYGKTVKALAGIYRKNGMNKVDIKLYPGARHELFNETIRDTVIDDVFSWIENTALAV